MGLVGYLSNAITECRVLSRGDHLRPLSSRSIVSFARENNQRVSTGQVRFQEKQKKRRLKERKKKKNIKKQQLTKRKQRWGKNVEHDTKGRRAIGLCNNTRISFNEGVVQAELCNFYTVRGPCHGLCFVSRRVSDSRLKQPTGRTPFNVLHLFNKRTRAPAGEWQPN